MKMPTTCVATIIKGWKKHFKNTCRKISTKERTDYVYLTFFNKKSSSKNDDFIDQQTKQMDINKKKRKAHSNINIQPKITYCVRLKKILKKEV